jgi:hypothetical protein
VSTAERMRLYSIDLGSGGEVGAASARSGCKLILFWSLWVNWLLLMILEMPPLKFPYKNMRKSLM